MIARKTTDRYIFSGYNKPVTNIFPNKNLSIEDVYELIISEKYLEPTDRIRNAGTKEKKGKIKAKELDYVTFSGLFSKRGKDGLIQHSNLFSVDIDNLSDSVNFDELKTNIAEALPPALMFTSPRGNGLKVIYKVSITEEDTHQKYFEAFTNFFKSELNITIDNSCSDVPRACFLCHDKEAYFNPETYPQDRSFLDTFCLELSAPFLEEIESSIEEIKKQTATINNTDNTGLTCWDDFNHRTSFLDVVSDELELVRETSEKYILKRFNATSSHSGYIFKDNNIMYLFSDATTTYSSRKAYTPFTAYCEKHHSGNLSLGAKDLYQKGYGDRIEAKKIELKSTSLIPIDFFPDFIKGFINEYIDVYNVPRDYIAASVIFSTAFAIGDKIELKGKYNNIPLLWLAIVGNVSSGKTDPLKTCLSYFTQKDSNSFKEYSLKSSEFNAYEKLPAKEKKLAPPVEKPYYFQYLLNDYTPEALFSAHSINERGISIYRDELKGWFDDFNRYSKSGEQSTMLSTWNRQPLTINRASKEPINIPEPCIYVCGGIQPELLKDLAKDSRAENGFLSRIMFAYPDLDEKQQYSTKKLKEDTISDYHKYLSLFTEMDEILNVTLSKEAEEVYAEWFNSNVEITNKEPKGYLKGVYGKLDVISLRLAVVVHGMKMACNENVSNVITFETMNIAIELTEYFRETALKVYTKIFEDKSSALMKKEVVKFCSSLGASQHEIAKAVRVTQPRVNQILKEL